MRSKPSQKPEWFDINAYDLFEDFDIVEWFFQLAIRKSIYWLYWGKAGSDPTAPFFYIRERVFKSIKELAAIDRTILKKDDMELLSIYCPELASIDKRAKYINQSKERPVAGITKLDLIEYISYGDLGDEFGELLLSILNNRFGSNENNSEDSQKLPIDDELEYDNFGVRGTQFPALVNLSFNDSFIINDLKLQIAKWREGSGVIQKFGRQRLPTERDWLKCRLVPYFDLKIWELAEGVKLTQTETIELLFPLGGGFAEDNLRKTTQKNFQAITELSHPNALHKLLYIIQTQT